MALKKNLHLQNYKHIFIFKGLRNKVVSELRKVKSSYFMQLFADSQGNSLFGNMNKLTNQKSSQSKDITKLNINGKVSTDALEIANSFNTFFIQ